MVKKKFSLDRSFKANEREVQRLQQELQRSTFLINITVAELYRVKQEYKHKVLWSNCRLNCFFYLYGIPIVIPKNLDIYFCYSRTNV